MKKKSLFFAFLTTTTLLFAQNNSLRDVVAVIRPNYGDANVTFLNSFADNLAKEGYDSTASFVRRYAKGLSFGSGFAYTDPVDSNVYIVTNRHVVAQAQTVNIEFMLADLSTKSYNQCQIVASDNLNDLALIALPQGARLSRTLALSDQSPEEGDEVFSAGYPGLSDKPSWQIGKGIVSNSNIRVDNWVASKDGFIQHTAQVDPGSSGGPLLVRDPNSNRNYRVVGLNTWKAVGRQNANFAIKPSTLNAFVQDYLKSRHKEGKEKLKERAEQFLGISNDGYKEVVRFVSYNFVSKLTVDGFFQLIDDATEETRKEISAQFEEMLPMEGVRLIIAKTISEKLKMDGFVYSGIENYNEGGPVTVLFKKGEETIRTSWVLDQGVWCLSDISTIQFKDNTTWHVNKRFDYFFYSLDRDSYLGFQPGSRNIDLNYGIMAPNFRLLVGGSFGSINDLSTTSEWSDQTDAWEDVPYERENPYGGIRLAVGYQRVYSKNQISLIPYVEGMGNLFIPLGFQSAFGGVYMGARIGLDMAYQFSKSKDKCVLFGLAFTGRKSLVVLNSDPGILPSLTFHLGYCY